MEHVIEDTSILNIAYQWALLFKVNEWASLMSDQEPDSMEVWLQAQIDSRKRQEKMTVDEQEKLIHDHEKNFNGEETIYTGKTIGEMYRNICDIYADIRWYLLDSGELNYSEDIFAIDHQGVKDAQEKIPDDDAMHDFVKEYLIPEIDDILPQE